MRAGHEDARADASAHEDARTAGCERARGDARGCMHARTGHRGRATGSRARPSLQGPAVHGPAVCLACCLSRPRGWARARMRARGKMRVRRRSMRVASARMREDACGGCWVRDVLGAGLGVPPIGGVLTCFCVGGGSLVAPLCYLVGFHTKYPLRRGPKLSVSWILGLGDIHASRHAAQCCINCCRCTFEPKQAECGCRVVRLCASVDCADSGGV